MPLACAAAMGLGLAIDTIDVHPEALAGLCAAAGDWASGWRLHRSAMPATTALMIVLPAAALGCERPAARRARALCALAMFAGMIAAMPLTAPLAAALGQSAFHAMVAAMTAGMASGAAAAALGCKAGERLAEAYARGR
jgi:hypothetical protein